MSIALSTYDRMNLTTEVSDQIAVVTGLGRLDGHTARELQGVIDGILGHPKIQFLVIDMTGVNYLSSAGIRVFVTTHKKLSERKGSLLLAGIQEYCLDVLKIAGFADVWPAFATVQAAVNEARGKAKAGPERERFERAMTPAGDFWIQPWSDAAGAVLVLGHIEDVLTSRITAEQISSKRFSQTEFSIGLGGLGDRVEDYLPILGEMITIGGTMVWLPTDGHDTPDYLIPKEDTGAVMIRTGFNVAQAGDFNEMFLFRAADPRGATITEIYRALFDLAKKRRKDFRGGLSVAMRAEMTEVYGSGVRTSPILPNRPANGLMITHPDNFGAWFEIDREPRHRNVTALLAGVGIDLTADYSHYQPDIFGAAFYVNPANPNRSDQVLHNHGVFFTALPFPDVPTDLYREIESVVEQGDFIDMRHLLDGSRVRQAMVGVSYTQAFEKDPAGRHGHV